jgi:hypothetical protein
MLCIERMSPKRVFDLGKLMSRKSSAEEWEPGFLRWQ